VRSGDDIATLIAGSARDLASQNVRYAEMTITPYTQIQAGISLGEVVEGLDEGRSRARDVGVEFAWVFDTPGEMGQHAAEVTVEFAVESAPAGLVGFGLSGIEAGVDRSDFAWAFDRARAAGLKSVPHAGEADGPSSIRAALDALGADRIGHGVRAVEDPALLARLVDEKIPLEVCPSSNVCTGVFPSLRQHSLPALLEAGAFVTINTDDPPMFSTTLVDEYERIAATFDLDLATIAQLVRNGVEASFLDPAVKATLLAEIHQTEAASAR
jgi:adenosine deaminase